MDRDDVATDADLSLTSDAADLWLTAGVTDLTVAAKLVKRLLQRQMAQTERAVVVFLGAGVSGSTIAEVLGSTFETHAQQMNAQLAKVIFDPAVDLSAFDFTAALADVTAAVREVTPTETVLSSFTDAWLANVSSALDRLDLDDIAEIGRDAGARAAAAALWRGRVGATLDTQDVTELLGITRQALDSRKRTGSVLAIPGSGTSHYPVWQFDVGGSTAAVRPITLMIVTAFREYLDDVAPFTIAAWATSPQPELDDRTPAEWIVDGGDDEPLVLAARRTAHLEAQ